MQIGEPITRFEITVILATEPILETLSHPVNHERRVKVEFQYGFVNEWQSLPYFGAGTHPRPADSASVHLAELCRKAYT